MARMPLAAMSSAVAWAAPGGTVRMPTAMCMRWARLANLSMGSTGVSPTGAGLGRVLVEGGHDAGAGLLEARIVQEGGAQAAGPHQEGIRLAVPVQEAFDGGHEFGHLVAGLGPPLAARHGQVLAHLGVVHAQHLGHVRRGNLVLAGAPEARQVLVVPRQPAEGWEGDGGDRQARLRGGGTKIILSIQKS